ncbi:GNA1162 family protein [Segatella albensis]|uniref:GNA1162 family protein n=1 Tax=Segatella albensis TaxID=77768 RepID=UPI0003FE842D|nr:GNA1162 family protein [Segatella albensis]
MKKYIILALLTLLMSSCAEQITTRLAQYPKIYEEKPLTIAVMPPINQTNFVEAKDYFYTTLYTPLCEKGYYVYSPMMTMEMFQSESAYDAEQFINADLSQFRNVLGADAAMFTIIKSWKRYKLGGSITAGVEYILRSTKTGETLYHREGLVSVDTSVSSGSGGLLGALLDLAATAIVTSATDKVVAGRKCTTFVLSDMPEGRYGTKYDNDQKLPAGKSYVKATVK